MTSRVILGTAECPTRSILRIIKSSQSFHLLHEKWPSVARDLAVNEEDIKKLRKNLLIEKDELIDVVNDILDIWVGKEGPGTTLDKLTSALDSNELGSIADCLKKEFQPRSTRWDVPSYYISRTVISRNILDKNKLTEEFQTSKDIFVFTGITLSKLSNIIKTKMVVNSTAVAQERIINYNYILLDYPTHFSKICEKASVPVHMIKADENIGKWVHVKSHGALSAMRNVTDICQDFLTEAELINSLQSEVHPVCISDSPGMGKSTLLQHIGQQLSNTDNNRGVLLATMNDFVNVFILNDVHDDKKTALELTLYKLFSSSVAQRSSLSFKLYSKNVEIELLLDGLDEVTSSNASSTFDLLKYLSKIPSIRVWVTTRPHILHELEDSLNVFGYNIQAFTKQNQINFLKDFWLSQNNNLVKDRLEKFAEICLSELNAKLSKKERDVAGIPLQCLLVGEVFEEQAREHSDATNPNETWILQINSLVGLYQKLIEKQFTKYMNHYDEKCLTKEQLNSVPRNANETWMFYAIVDLYQRLKQKLYNFYWNYSDEKCLTEEQLNRQHITLAVQLIFPELLNMLPHSFKQGVNLNELLKVGLLEKSSTISEPKFVHRTIGEFFIAKLLAQISHSRADKKILKSFHNFIKKVLICQSVYVKFDKKRMVLENSVKTYRFVNDEICYFLDTLLTKHEEMFFSAHLIYEKLARACVYGDYFNLFKAILLSWKLNQEFSAQKLFNKYLLFLSVKFSSLSFLEIISENNPKLFDDPSIKAASLLLSIHSGKLPQVQYLLNVINLRELVTRPNEYTNAVLHECVKDSSHDSSSIVKQKIDIIELLLDINSELLEQLDEFGRTPILLTRTHRELLRELIKRGANILATDEHQNTVLHFHYNHWDVLFEQIPRETLKFLVNLKNIRGDTLLMTIIQNQEPSLQVLNKFKGIGADFNCKDDKGYSVLARSIIQQRTTKTIERLIGYGANVHWKGKTQQKSLLHYAAERRNIDVMIFLVSQFKMNIYEKDASLKSPIDYFIINSSGRYTSAAVITEFIDMLKGLNISLSSKNKIDILEISVRSMNDSAVEHFLKDGVQFIEKQKQWEIVKSLIGHFKLGPGNKILKSFINSGIIEWFNNSLVVNTIPKKHFLVHGAVELKGREIITCIVNEFKQDVNATDHNGNTPLQLLVNRI